MITLFQKTRMGINTYRLRAESDITGATFYWWVNGALASVGTMPFYDLTVGENESVEVDVFDSALSVPDPAFPSRAHLEWENNAARYVIFQFDDPDWVQRGDMSAPVLGSVRWQSGVLADCTEHLFRVSPLGEDLNTGVARQFSVFMVRRPDPPTLTLAYDGTDVEASFT